MATHHSSAYSRTEVSEEQCDDADPGMMTTQGSRHIFDNSWQPPAHGKQTATLEAFCYSLEKRITNVEKFIERTEKKNRDWAHSVNTRLQHLESCNGAFPGKAVRKDLQEENEKLKGEIKKLEARNAELLSKAMAMHKHSEDMNDPSRLTAVLQRYEMLQLHEWEKVRTSTPHPWTYEQGSHVIKRLFDACEEDLQQRTADIFTVLGIPPSNDTMTNSKQGIMREIRNLFGQSCYQNYSEVYREIVKKAGVHAETAIQSHFILQCCRIYCLLLLQDPPVKAEWNTEGRSAEDLEHVDKKDVMYWKKPVFLWPIMKRGEQTILRGVVWDEK
ncbi:uncharacterized protein LOC126645181 [Myiozetetes cayanensis]|uniref:uncharacterized protein LOC126645181 n=1 Tax=Myiozetetes cayanensis TaxID=478635 RepID=UPI00215E28CF|nr:uncharacterized protein LOC126645181 [Myiozetetes cayanensis]